MIKKDDKRNDLSADNNVEKLDLYLEQKLKLLLSQPFVIPYQHIYYDLENFKKKFM